MENEMEMLEKNIIKNYNELLKTLIEEGDMDTLEKVITDDAYREKLMQMHTSKLKAEHEIEDKIKSMYNINANAFFFVEVSTWIHAILVAFAASGRYVFCARGPVLQNGCRARSLLPAHG